jgi:hypothetical protein
MTCRPLSAAVVAVVMAGTALADESRPANSVLSVGSRVRLRSTAFGGEVEGLVAAVDEQALTLAAGDRAALKVPLASILGAETSIGHRRHTLVGLGAGVLGGLLLGLAAQVDPNNCGAFSNSFCSRGDALRGGAVGGGLIGAGIGALIKSDRWAPVQIGGTSATGERSGFGVRIAFRF